MKSFCLIFLLGSLCLSSYSQLLSTTDESIQSKSISIIRDFNYAIQELNKVLLQWTVDNNARNDYFIVERGMDSVHFETLGILKREEGIFHYEIADNNALNGFNYYRIRYADSTGALESSRLLQVNSGKSSFRFYPNPADKMLIVETDVFTNIQILNTMGTVLISLTLQKGVQILDISSLGKGDFIIRAYDKKTNKSILEHLLKN